MDTKDANRLRTAVKENNLFLVKRLIARTNLRNPDPTARHFTSLAWTAVLGHEETFEFLLTAGHDDEELSKDSENNTILMLLAELKSPSVDSGAALRMARLYYDRYAAIYPALLDWSDRSGKTALHHASLKGNEELVRMLCDLGADYDLADNLGNTPLHYASAWNHIPIVQLLIERGCQYTARNNEGFTASDYAYSFSTRETLQDSARLQFEANKKSRRAVFAQVSARGTDRNGVPPSPSPPPPLPSKTRDNHIRLANPRMRSGSGTSRTTATSDSGEHDHIRSQSSLSTSSSPPTSFFPAGHGPTLSIANSLTAPSLSLSSALSPVASRMRERDADAMEKYLNRNRSGSSSTDKQSLHSVQSVRDDVSPLSPSGASTPRRLRPSVSASQLRASPEHIPSSPEHRSRAGTNPTPRPANSPLLSRSSSSGAKTLISPQNHRSMAELFEETYTGPPSRYAQFPDPPTSSDDHTTPTGRRIPFNILTKSPTTLETSRPSHRREVSAASLR